MMRLLNEMERIRANIGECKYRQMQFARTPGVSHTPACIFSGIYGRMQFAGFFGRMQFAGFLGECNSPVRFNQGFFRLLSCELCFAYRSEVQ